ncbi:MAG: methyltransferase domain-containing protein [Phycisphaerae bacterium]|jgi:SAM-dependent methyltransferase|nr:methyltransferase domain-containing protein [Phycisphaerae bacterium]
MSETKTDPQPMCLPGLHEAVAQKIARRISPDSPLLDIAAGSGAFTRRLLDMGMSVIANDADGSRWGIPEIDLMNVDLNTDFAEEFAGAGVEAIAAIEVIEHLDNPRDFLRQCRQLLPDGGFMFVTTPNVTSAASRAMFLRSGRTVFFSEGGPCAGEHITFLPWWLLADHARAAGWEVIETEFAGQYTNLGFKVRLSRFLAAMLGRYDRPGEKKFGCTVMTLRKS